MALDRFPYEIKRLIYEDTSLETLKILRQVSKSWASAGLDLLLLPNFTIKSSLDVQRMLAISTSHNVSQHAAKTVKCLIFQTHGWDPRYFRNIVCNRHELRQDYEALDFVPTQAERAALDELDAVIRQKDIDMEHDKDLSALISAFRQVPRVDAVKIFCQNPFVHPILRKSWEEYTLEAFQRKEPQYYQLLRILSAAKEAGLVIRHLTHERLLSGFFDTPSFQMQQDILSTLKNLQSLSLVISDLPAFFTNESGSLFARNCLRRLIFNCHLQSLSLTFEVLGTIPMSFLEPDSQGNYHPPTTLHTLSIAGIAISPDPFMTLLSQNPNLKRLSIRNTDLPPGVSWRSFLTTLRDGCSSTIEKFQLAGMVRSADHKEENWILFPVYDEEWRRIVTPRNERTREVGDFVLRGGHWPMIASDTLDITIS